MRLLALIAIAVLGAGSPAHGASQSVWTNFYHSPRFDVPVALARESQNNICTLLQLATHGESAQFFRLRRQ